MSSPQIELGLLLHTRHLIRDGDRGSHVKELWKTAARADEMGFDHLWVGDSPRLSMQDRAHADCFTMAAALAARTHKIKIGIVPFILAMRNPVLAAHSLATLDVISGGRTLVGVSAGHQYQFAQREFEACGVPYDQRAGRLNESIQLLRRLWTETSFAFEGKYYRFEELGIEPKPVQRTIPIWVAASNHENALRRVARLGDGWFTVAHTATEFLDRRRKIGWYVNEHGRADSVIPSLLFATFHLSYGATAEQDGWSLAESYFRQPRAKLSHITPFFGTPEQCAEKLRAYIDAGLTGIVARLVAADFQTQMRLMLEELRPRLLARSVS
jgi:alkanesulfonate monooxygenase SsuD/methylene tetrahydromethanopterin reductase-like flavin-dependent oxidoreductase (luciferase family)